MAIIRLPNLLIAGLSEYLFLYCLLVPLFQRSGVKATLDQLEFFFLVLATILVTLGGYIINDVFDVTADKVNKPGKVWVGRIATKKQAWFFYYLINTTGFLIAIYTAVSLDSWQLSLLYPLAVIGLYFYSRFLKQLPLVGNIFVSVFCALVFVLVLFAERHAFSQAGKLEPEFALHIYQVFLGFAFFAFLITMMREMVKDLEDMPGDKKAGLKTFPIVYGPGRSENIILILFYLTSALGLTFIVWNIRILEWNPWGCIYGLFFILLPLLWFLSLFRKNGDLRDYKKMSKVLKLLMVGGLLYLPLFRLFAI